MPPVVLVPARPLGVTGPDAVPRDQTTPGKIHVRSMSNLSVADGFKFGCGLILAGVAFYFVLIIVSALVFLLVTLLDISLPTGIRSPIG